METDEPLDWGDIFFILHKHCNLNKWELYEYTLPQVIELMKRANRYIEFEVSTRMTPFGMMGGVAPQQGFEKEIDGNAQSDEYEEITEDDVNALARILGGG